MTLPINTALTYTIEIPSTKKKIKYRPFLVKEKKQLMIAHQSEDSDVMIDTLKNVLRSCINNNDKVDVDSLAVFDLEYLFINIRAKSDGEDAELLFGCDSPGCEDNPKARIKLKFDLTKIPVTFPENHTNKFTLFGDVGVILKYPNLDTLVKIESIEEDSEILFSLIIDSIESIYDSENLYPSENYTREQLVEFIDNLDSSVLNKFVEFFNNLPRLEVPIKYTCPVCSKEHDYTLKGINSFF